MDEARKKEIEKALIESRQEYAMTNYGLMAYANNPNFTDKALVEVQYELLNSSLELTKIQNEMLRENKTL